MNTKKFSEAMNEIGDKYYEEAINYRKNTKKPVWAKWGIVAAAILDHNSLYIQFVFLSV